MYGTNEGFIAYHNARGRGAIVSAFDDDEITVARLNGSEWIDNTYRAMFPGWKVGQFAQLDEWPRNDAYDVNGDHIPSNSVPVRVEYATYEAGLLDLQGVALITNYTPSKYKRASVEGAVSVEYSMLSGATAQTQFVNVDRVLSPLLTGGIGTNGLCGELIRR